MNWLYNLKTQRKMLILNILLAINLAWISVSAIMRMSNINGLIETMYKQKLLGVSVVRELETRLSEVDGARKSVMLMTGANRAEQVDVFKSQLADTEATVNKAKAVWANEKSSKAAEDFARISANIADLLPQEATVVDQLIAGDEGAMATAMQLEQSVESMQSGLTALAAGLEKDGEKAFLDSQSYFKGTVMGQIWLNVVGVIINVLMGIFIAGLITKPLGKMAKTTDLLSEGVLTEKADVDSRDEIGLMAKALNKAIDNLRLLITQVSRTAEQVATSSEQLAASSSETGKTTSQVAGTIEQLAKGTEEQAKSSTTADETVGQMTQLLSGMTAKLRSMVEDSGRASDLARTGKESVGKAIGQMTSIRETVDSSALAVKGLGERSREIGQIVDVITGIADQTNLLALNAAIEAARAGEQGRGFAVVAEEVRKLAEQSRQAAEKISGLIREIQTETGKAVAAMEAGTKEVAAGTSVIDNTGSAFAQIAEAVETVVHQINEVSDAAKQVVDGSEQVVQAVENIANITEEAAASAEEVSASAEEQTASVQQIAASAEALARMAQELQHEVSKFQV